MIDRHLLWNLSLIYRNFTVLNTGFFSQMMSEYPHFMLHLHTMFLSDVGHDVFIIMISNKKKLDYKVVTEKYKPLHGSRRGEHLSPQVRIG